MKTISNTLRTAVVLSTGFALCSVGYAANDSAKSSNNSTKSTSQATTSSSSTNANQSGVYALQNYSKGQRLGDVIGREVRTTSGKEIGKVKDLVVDRASGQIRFVLVSSGGVLGVGDTIRAVPPGAITSDKQKDDACKISIDDTKWRNAPTIADNQLSALEENQRGRQIYDYYGQQWNNSSSSNSGKGLVNATEIKGKDLNADGRKIGEIDDLMVNLQKQKVSAVVDPDDNFVGNDSKYVVSFDKLNVSSSGNGAYSTSLKKSDFQNASAMTEDLWLVPTYVAIYTWDIPAANANDHAARKTSGTSQASNNNNQKAPTNAVESAIKTDSQDHGQSIAVSTQNGRVVLKGNVPSEDAKDRIEKKAEKAANGYPIDNEIKVTSSE